MVKEQMYAPDRRPHASFLRDFLLSFCPAGVRQVWRPHSELTALRSALWSGMAQFLLIALVLIFELKEYFIARSHQLAPHIAGSNETGQAIITVMVAIEFLFHPLSLLLLYLALEGRCSISWQPHHR
jgi:hypothetical protein